MSEKKPYWTWTCKCGFDDNRNTDKVCKSCGTKINCDQAGGHYTNGKENGDYHHCCRCGMKLA